jgi:hypothetical protein
MPPTCRHAPQPDGHAPSRAAPIDVATHRASMAAVCAAGARPRYWWDGPR